MPSDQFGVPSVLLPRITALGVDCERVMRDAGIAMARFREPKARLTTSEFLALWRTLQAVAAPDFGVRLASEALPHQYDVATTAALHSANLGEALAKKARYKRLTCPQEIIVETAGDEAHVRSRWILADGTIPPLLVDTTCATVVELARRGTATRLAPQRIDLARRRPGRDVAALLARYFACDLVFDAPVDAVVFDASTLATPFVTHNADLVHALATGLETALDERSRDRSVADDARAALRRRLSGERLSIDKIAQDLHLSARTLQRKLGELGTSYQALLDEVRRQAARNLLATTDLDASEVAFLLGFVELNSFARAFQAWEGASPNQWRQRRTAATAPGSVSRVLRRT